MYWFYFPSGKWSHKHKYAGQIFLICPVSFHPQKTLRLSNQLISTEIVMANMDSLWVKKAVVGIQPIIHLILYLLSGQKVFSTPPSCDSIRSLKSCTPVNLWLPIVWTSHKYLRERLDGNEIILAGRQPFSIRLDAAGRNQTMYMRMILKGSTPGMQNDQNTNQTPDIMRIGGQFDQWPTGGFPYLRPEITPRHKVNFCHFKWIGA